MPLSYQISYFVTAFLNVVVALAIVAKRPTERVVRLFGFFVLAISAWIITLFFFYTLTDAVSVLVAGRINFVFAEMIAYFAFLFAYEFPKRTFTLPKWSMNVLGAAVVALMTITFATDLVDQEEIIKGISRVTVYGPLYNLFILQFIGFSIASIVILVKKYKVLTGVARRQLLAFAFGWGGTVTVGVTTNIVLPLVTGNYDIQNIGPLSTLILVFATAYAVARHELLNVKVIATEGFVALMLFLFVIEIAISPSPIHQIVSGLLLLLAAGLGLALIQGVNAEVRRREDLQSLSAELADANAHLQELDKLKSEFISIASHQLRTPISVIKGYLSLFLEGAYGDLGADAKQKLAQMFSINERIVRMVNNMLNVSRIEAGRVEFECGPFDLDGLIKEAVEEIRLKAKEQGLAIEYKSPGEPVPAYADRAKLQEVLMNLLDNAIKYTEKGTVEIGIDPHAKKDAVKVWIADQGIGMNKEERRHLFEKFYRAKEPLVEHKTGTGLGLYICARFLEAMGGDIAVERSVPGEGTTIAFVIPAKEGVECKLRYGRTISG